MPTNRLAIGPIEHVDPTSLARFGDGLDRLAIDRRVVQDGRARRVEVPDIVVHLLEVPRVGAIHVQRDHRHAEQVVARSHGAVVVRAGVARGEVDQPEVRIDRRVLPDGRATVLVGLRLDRIGIVRRRPRVAADVARTRERSRSATAPGRSRRRARSACRARRTRRPRSRCRRRRCSRAART